MITIGEYQQLSILRATSVGLFLGDEDGNDILLPHKYVPREFRLGDSIRVFCYLDHDERPVATTLEPYITRNNFGLLQAAEVNELGAFMDWGLEKHLFVPFREQARRMEQGKYYLVYMYLDEKTNRLTGSSKTDRFLQNQNLTVKEGDAVDLMVYRFTDLGVEMIINEKHKGLVFSNDVYATLKLGARCTGFVKKIREDHKIDLSLQPLGYQNLEPSAQKVYTELLKHNGYLPLHDHSDPEEIKHLLQMSKKNFKRAVGVLYKQHKIDLEKKGIRIRSEESPVK